LNNYNYINKIYSQLEKADKQKRILTRNIYREYELYLNLVRDLLFISVKKGLYQIYSYPTINDNFLNENEFYSLFEKKISKLIFTNLPFLTLEQLKTYQSILDSGDPRIWRLAIDNEISNDEKELYLLNMIKKSGNIND